MSKTLITLSDVSKRYDDRREVLCDVNLSIAQGDFVAITGPNGGGKTTLLRILLRLLNPTSGNVTYGTDDLTFGYLPQKNKIDSQFPITVRELVSQGIRLKPFRAMNAEQNRRIDDVIALVGMTDKASDAIGDLSGGQLQRALIARAIVGRPQVLVLDEPLSYLDKQFERQLYDMLKALMPDTTIILVSHEMTAIARMATRHLIVGTTVHECLAHEHYVVSECR